MSKLCDAEGGEAVVGKSRSYWLCQEDFVTSADGKVDPLALGEIGFPRDWPAAYTQSAPLKSLIGKRGVIAARRVAVAGVPSSEEKAHAGSLTFFPLQSFANAERAAAQKSGMAIVQGWAVFERLDRPVGEVFVAERYWWNALPDGRWVDLTPRPESWQSLLLAEASQGAPKQKVLLTANHAMISSRLLSQRFPGLCAGETKSIPPSMPTPKPAPMPPKPAVVKATPPQKVTASVGQAAKPLDYSKWKNIVDSDEESGNDEASPAPEQANGKLLEFGVKDLAEGAPKPGKQPPPPDYLVGNTGGGGGTNCFLSICKLLDADLQKGEATENTHQLAQVFGKSFHCALHDEERQSFYRKAIESVPPAGAFFLVLGLGSVLPLLLAAKRGKGLLLEMSARLCKTAEDLLVENGLSGFPVAPILEGLDKEEQVAAAVAQHVPANVSHVVILTERFANDMLSNGVVPASLAAHKAITRHIPKARLQHLPQTAELFATPMEIRSERLGDHDIRPFNAFRHTTSNDKADFWWWGVRLDNQPHVNLAMLGPSKTLCGFDFDRSPEITLDEVRRTLKLDIHTRGRCNAVALWWTAKFNGLEYSTKPALAREAAEPAKQKAPKRPEWKQAIHYLAGETSVFVGDILELLVSITPRFTVRMMQQSPFSVEAPPWIMAPTHSKFSATMPILPYHFLMMTDIVRLQNYSDSIRAAVRQAKERLGRRPRVLDAGCGIGLLGMTAALEGAEVWLCEAVGQMRQMCREVVAVNAAQITEKKGLVQLLPPMMSTRLQIGEAGDIQEPFDIVVSEVMDLWCLGEGVIPTMKHACNKLLAKDGVMLPSRLVIFVQPLELLMWNQAEREHKAKLSALTGHFKAKFSPMRIAQFQHRWLTDDPIPALEIDLRNVPDQPADGEPNLDGVKLCIRMGGKPALHAKISTATVEHSGMLCGYGIWWAADLGNGHVITSAPSNPQRSWKQLVRWLDEPRFVSEGEDIQMLACYNENQVNVEDVFMPREMVEQYQEQLQAGSGQRQGQASSTTEKPKGAPTAALPEDDDVVEVD